MNFGPYTYLLLNVMTLLGPLALSFDRKVAFFRSWKALFPAIILTGAVFLIWDILFTEWDVWHFNPDYVLGVYLLGLPLEEWLFFFTVPYASVFIYACLQAYFPSWELKEAYLRAISWVLLVSMFWVGILFAERMYTSVTAFLLTLWFIVLILKGKAKYLGHFFQAWLVVLIPLFIINGALTSLPVVIYNDAENLGIRLGTIPLEDLFYNMLLLLMNVSLFELFRQRGQIKPSLTS